jgi:Uma2 family endonuclease
VHLLSPDITVVCGRSDFDDERGDVLLNPLIIFEVLSDSTEQDDRGRKFHVYLTIESLRQYVLVWNDEYVVEQFRREADQWFYSKAEGPNATLRLSTAECELPLREIYCQVLESPLH